VKRSVKVLAVVALLVLGVAAFVAFFIFSDAVPKSSFDHISEGMTEAEVQSLLGVPDRVRHDTPTTTAYFYGGFLRAKWCSMEVFFGADGRVTGTFHDH
jgi:hypothetical protein